MKGLGLIFFAAVLAIAGATRLEVSVDRIVAPLLGKIHIACMASSSTGGRMEWRRLHMGVDIFTEGQLHRLTGSAIDALHEQSDLLNGGHFYPTHDGKENNNMLTHVIPHMGANDIGQYVCVLSQSQSVALVRVVDVTLTEEHLTMERTPAFDVQTVDNDHEPTLRVAQRPHSHRRSHRRSHQRSHQRRESKILMAQFPLR